jgi:hypothetical protein
LHRMQVAEPRCRAGDGEHRHLQQTEPDQGRNRPPRESVLLTRLCRCL